LIKTKGYIKLYKKLTIFQILFLTVFIVATSLFATDEEANIETDKANTALKNKKYRDAAAYYMAAKLYADSPDLKLEALKKAAYCYDKANLKYKEFLCLQELITGFSDQIEFDSVIKKEFELANDFTSGHRDVKLSWLPWIKGKNKSIEIYETILKQAPFAKFAAPLKLRLGRVYLEDGKHVKALDMFRRIIKEHPDAEECKFARFELANALVQLSEKAGDGDGAYAREAEENLIELMKKYPNSSETKWLQQAKKDTNKVRAKRLYDIAEFYQSRKNDEAASRYYNDLLARYPSSFYAKKAIKYFKKADPNYTPPPYVQKQQIDYPITELKAEPKVILVAPQASGGKWLLPVEDLDLDGQYAENEFQSKREAEKLTTITAKQERERIIEAKLAEKKREVKNMKKVEIKPETEEERIDKIIKESCEIIEQTESESESVDNQTESDNKHLKEKKKDDSANSFETDYEIIHESTEHIEDIH
jgi:outer membrane protein assembly factor BamD (BamD/ComL family)